MPENQNESASEFRGKNEKGKTDEIASRITAQWLTADSQYGPECDYPFFGVVNTSIYRQRADINHYGIISALEVTESETSIEEQKIYSYFTFPPKGVRNGAD